MGIGDILETFHTSNSLASPMPIDKSVEKYRDPLFSF
jgi:hypothetical protein